MLISSRVMSARLSSRCGRNVNFYLHHSNASLSSRIYTFSNSVSSRYFSSILSDQVSAPSPPSSSSTSASSTSASSSSASSPSGDASPASSEKSSSLDNSFRPRRSSSRKGLLALILGGAIGVVGGWLLITEDWEEIKVGLGSVRRGIRATTCCILIIADYKWSLWLLDENSDTYAETLSRLHTRNAERLLALCQSSVGGIFIKAGQHICSLKPVVPAEYANVLSVLQDSVEPRSFAQVMKTLDQELGQARQQIKSIDPKPLGTASLAQVHKGELVDGTAVAIKIQHAHMDWMVRADLHLLDRLTAFVDWNFSQIKIRWIMQEVNDSILSELNFLNEAKNSEKCAYNFRQDPSIYVPKVYYPLSTERVLTMEFIKGVKVNDIQGIKAAGLKSRDIAQIVLSLFSAQIFCHGLVHCDPHPGNMLVRSQPNGAPQVVLLDHGLYRKFDPNFRANFCELWMAMLHQDKAKLKEVCAKFKINEMHAKVLPVIFIHRSIDATNNLGERMSDAERKQIHKLFAGTAEASHVGTVGWFTEFLRGIPRDMLFVLRTLNLVRALNLELGGTSRERFLTQSDFAILGSYYRPSEEGLADPPNDFLSLVAIFYERNWLHVRLFLLESFKSLRGSVARFFVEAPPVPSASKDEHWLKR